jgi:hypothetical protein
VASTVFALGMGLERLTQPELIDADSTVEVQRLWLDGLLAQARRPV